MKKREGGRQREEEGEGAREQQRGKEKQREQECYQGRRAGRKATGRGPIPAMPPGDACQRGSHGVTRQGRKVKGSPKLLHMVSRTTRGPRAPAQPSRCRSGRGGSRYGARTPQGQGGRRQVEVAARHQASALALGVSKHGPGWDLARVLKSLYPGKREALVRSLGAGKGFPHLVPSSSGWLGEHV